MGSAGEKRTNYQPKQGHYSDAVQRATAAPAGYRPRYKVLTVITNGPQNPTCHVIASTMGYREALFGCAQDVDNLYLSAFTEILERSRVCAAVFLEFSSISIWPFHAR